MAIKVAGQEVISDERKITGAIGLDLTPIEASIADTAVDVFVYDTRKDSDGGAWRKRTQHTSWYNETLNTATRGARKEFPAVAVIVVESGQMTIYDGDDPDLPMWMVFNSGQTDAFMRTSTIKATTALNGQFVYCGSFDTYIVDFIRDDWRMYDNGSIWKSKTSEAISQRNDLSGIYIWKTGGLVNRSCNDIAMTVLPNAPIDPATQLPIPTIAVATDGGVSVITDSGAVYDYTSGSYAFLTVDFTNDYKLVANSYTGSSDSFYMFDIPASDTTTATYIGRVFDSNWSGSYQYLSNIAFYDVSKWGPNGTAVGCNNRLIINENHYRQVGSGGYEANDKALFSDITSTYNTGWMNGDIKLATLSDTDATNVTGTELVTNGTFDTDTSGWNVSSGTITWDSGSGGRALVTSTSGGGERAYQAIPTVVGQTYTVSVYTDANSNGATPLLYINGALKVQPPTNYVGWMTTTFVASTTSTTIGIGWNAPVSGYYDNISVRLAEEDRSVNGNGLQVFGTVTKTPVDEV